MASLYKSTSRARKIVLGLLVVALCVMVYDFVNSLQSTVNQSVSTNTRRFYLDPDRALGDVPAPEIPTIERDTNNNATYVVESVFPTFPDAVYVYSIEEPVEKLQTFANAQATVEELGFSPQDFTQLTQDVSEWQKDNGTTQVTFDKVNLIWDMQTNLSTNPRYSDTQVVTLDQSDLEDTALDLVNDLGFETFGFGNGVASGVFIERQANGEFIEVTTPQEAQLALLNAYRVIPLADLKPSNIRPELLPGESLPVEQSGQVYTADPNIGSVQFLTEGDDPQDIFELEFVDYEYTQNTGVYLIITPQEAWTNVQLGEGSLVQITPQNDDTVGSYEPQNVRRFVLDAQQTELGYYEPVEWDGFVYPIYIFRGRAELENGRQASFTFYAEAITRL